MGWKVDYDIVASPLPQPRVASFFRGWPLLLFFLRYLACPPPSPPLQTPFSNTALTSLNLSGNRLPAVELQRIADALGAHPSLVHLTLAGESVNDSAALDVGRLVSSGRLASLDLRRSALAGAGAVSLARSLSPARGLTRLDLSDNSLGVAAARELAGALQSGGGAGFAVRFLGLARCGLGPEGGALVARALGGNRSVEELDASDNGLGKIAGVALARSLRVLYRSGKEVCFCLYLCRVSVSVSVFVSFFFLFFSVFWGGGAGGRKFS